MKSFKVLTAILLAALLVFGTTIFYADDNGTPSSDGSSTVENSESSEPSSNNESSEPSSNENSEASSNDNSSENASSDSSSESSEPSEPSGSSEDTEPYGSSEATEPSASSEPTDPSESSEVTEPSASSEVTEPSASSEPTDPSESSEVTEPSESSEVTEPSASSEVTEPSESSSSSEPSESSSSSEPSESSSESEPSESSSETEPSEISEVTEPSESSSQTEPSESSSETTPSESSSETTPSESSSATEPTSTEERPTPVYYGGKLLIGWQYSDGRVNFIQQDTAQRTGRALDQLLNNDKVKTIILPKGTVKIAQTLYIGDNTTIIADGATIVQAGGVKPIIDTVIDKTDYSSVKNIRISGGTWKIPGNKPNPSVMRFSHGQKITIENITINVKVGEHALSFIACKDVTITGSKFTTSGKFKQSEHEEVLQIDLATPYTAPNCAKVGKKFANGQVCKNITITNCTILGGRGLCFNKVTEKSKAWLKKNGVSATHAQYLKWLKKHHVNVTITGCTITGVTGEALALHNTAKFTIKNNTIISKGKKTSTVYTIGLNIRSFGKNDITSKYTSTVSGNTIKGGYIGFYVGTNYANKFGKITITGNKVYCKKGKDRCLILLKCKKALKNNKLYKWK